jgi:hypothetical protein
MTQRPVIRVSCMNGPCHGPKLMNAATGHILLAGIDERQRYIYRLDSIPHVPTATRTNACFERIAS